MNDLDAVKQLTSSDVNINSIETDGSTALHWAIYNENFEMVESLIDAESDVSIPTREGVTPLSLASQMGNSRITALLLNAGADVNQTMSGGETPLMMAARTGDIETIKVILDHGADLNARENRRGTTALMWAAAYQNPEAVEFLIASGADMSMRSATAPPGREPYIAPSARKRIRDYYFETGPNGAQVTVDIAAFGGNDKISNAPTREELVRHIPKELLEAFKKEEESLDSNQVSPTHNKKKEWGGLTPLHFAVREGDIASIKVLVEAGADVNQVSEYGWTPLLTATQNRYYRIGKYLLEHGANPNIANEGGWNPLYIATDNRNIEAGDYPTRKPDMDHLEFIKLLLEAGADPNLHMQSSTETRTIFTHQWLREDGATPFLRAAQSSDLELMHLLLEYGADPNINTRDGVTPLMVASGIAWVEGVTYEWSEDANKETIRLLLELGNDPNAQDFVDRRSALMGAAHKGRNYAVRMLVDAGADLAARDIGSRDSMGVRTGVTWQAIDYAEGLVRVGVQSAAEHPETAKLIRKLMKERGMEVPPEGRTLDSICIVDICK